MRHRAPKKRSSTRRPKKSRKSPTITLHLPELAAADLTADNIRAAGEIYFVHQCEEMKVFQVVDRLIELAEQRSLPLGQGRAAKLMHSYFRKRPERFSELQRKALYARVLGIPGGNTEESPSNRDFAKLWMDFVSAVSAFARQADSGKTSQGRLLKNAHIRKAAQDLASNLALHGWGMAYFAAVELHKQIEDAMAIVSTNEVSSPFRATTPWQVIERVAARDLSGAPNLAKHRTQANAGRTIIQWLAAQIDRNKTPANTPDDNNLLQACEQWLAAGGVDDSDQDT